MPPIFMLPLYNIHTHYHNRKIQFKCKKWYNSSFCWTHKVWLHKVDDEFRHMIKRCVHECLAKRSSSTAVALCDWVCLGYIYVNMYGCTNVKKKDTRHTRIYVTISACIPPHTHMYAHTNTHTHTDTPHTHTCMHTCTYTHTCTHACTHTHTHTHTCMHTCTLTHSHTHTHTHAHTHTHNLSLSLLAYPVPSTL